MFIGRRPDGSIYGSWTVRQPDDADHPGQEELPDDHPEVIEFENRKPNLSNGIGVKGQRARALDALALADPEIAKFVAVLKTADLI